MTMENEPLLQVKDLTKSYSAEEGGFFAGLLGGSGQRVPALNGVSFELREGEVLGLIGESGSGKSALARIIAGQEKPDKGTVTFAGRSVTAMGENDLKALRRNLRYLPEDALGNLTSDPKNRVDRLLFDLTSNEPATKGGVSRGAALEMLRLVGLGEEYLTRFPNQMSGGERQRLAIARALLLKPRLLVADEPVSNLDLNNRTQILNLMKRVGRENRTAFIFISHSPSMVRYFVGGGRVAIMFAGRFMEELPARTLFDQATHPYTKSLLDVSSVPSPLPAAALDPAQVLAQRERAETDTAAFSTLESEMSAEGNIAALAQIAATGKGCPFYRWCPERFERCPEETPLLLPVQTDEDAQHRAACLRYNGQ